MKWKVKFAALVVAFVLVSCAGNNPTITRLESDQQTQRPNIVLIVADDHGTDAIGAYGNPVIKTPNLDALARDGTIFTQAFGTTSSCSPSRAVLLTGLHNHMNGMYGLEHKHHHYSSFDHILALPVLLQRGANYRTGRIGKYHIGPEAVYRFETVLSEGAANDMSSIARSPVEMARSSKSFIENKDQPFFLYFASDDPHRAFPFKTDPAPNSFGNRPEGYSGIDEVLYDPKDVLVPAFLPDTEATRLELAQYYQSVSRLDQGVGELIQMLKDAGQYERTIILYLSDNGIAFPGAKTTLYDAGIRLPLIVRTPDQTKRGVVSDSLISWTDITPTILDYAGVSTANNKLHGVSFRAAIDAIPGMGRTEVFGSHSFHEIQMYYPMRMVRTQKYKLIHNLAYPLEYPNARDLYESITWQDFQASRNPNYGERSIGNFIKRPEYELYDLENDPGETVNLALNPNLSAVLEELKALLLSFQQETEDPWYPSWRD